MTFQGKRVATSIVGAISPPVGNWQKNKGDAIYECHSQIPRNVTGRLFNIRFWDFFFKIKNS